MGQVIILWSSDIPKDGTQVWQRYTHAPKFSKGFACQSADSEPIAMTLESGHCKLLLPPDGSKFPERWLRETDIPPSQKLAGAGKSASVVSAKSSLDVPDTPSVHTILRSPVRRKAKKNVESLGSIPPKNTIGPFDQACCQSTSKAVGNFEPGEQKTQLQFGTQFVGNFCQTQGSHSSAPRKSGLNDQSEPYIQLPEQIFVWWTCSCGFQVLQHKDLTCHGPRRKKHLNQVHGIQYSDMPPDPLGAPDAEGTQTRREERVKRCQRWLNIAKNHGWAGMHELTPVNLGWRRWKCQSCDESFTHWNRGSDWNANPHTGPLPEFLASVNGPLCGSSGHIRSTTPTDSVWISESSVCREHSVLDPLSDHFGGCWHAAPAPQAWEFQKVAPLIPDIPLPSKADSVAAWTRVATPEDVWSDCLQGDIDKCWLQWSGDAEAYLHQVGAVQSRSGVVPRGREPRLKTGVSKHGPGQSLSERQLMHVRRGTIPPRNLQQACLRSCSFFGFEDEGRQRAWGRCLALTKDRLNQVLRQSQKDALNNWRHSVVSHQGACRWLRQKAPPPWTLESPNRLSTGRAAGAAHLRDTWEELFGPAGYSPPIQTFFLEFDEWIPTLPPLRLPDLTVPALQSCVSSMRHKAAGTDGCAAPAGRMLEAPLGNFPIGRKLRLLAPGFVPLAHNICTKGAISRFCWYPSFKSSSHFGRSSFV